MDQFSVGDPDVCRLVASLAHLCVCDCVEMPRPIPPFVLALQLLLDDDLSGKSKNWMLHMSGDEVTLLNLRRAGTASKFSSSVQRLKFEPSHSSPASQIIGFDDDHCLWAIVENKLRCISPTGGPKFTAEQCGGGLPVFEARMDSNCGLTDHFRLLPGNVMVRSMAHNHWMHFHSTKNGEEIGSVKIDIDEFLEQNPQRAEACHRMKSHGLNPTSCWPRKDGTLAVCCSYGEIVFVDPSPDYRNPKLIDVTSGPPQSANDWIAQCLELRDGRFVVVQWDVIHVADSVETLNWISHATTKQNVYQVMQLPEGLFSGVDVDSELLCRISSSLGMLNLETGELREVPDSVTTLLDAVGGEGQDEPTRSLHLAASKMFSGRALRLWTNLPFVAKK